MDFSFKDLKRNLKKDFSGYRFMKVALLGDSATQLLATALRGYGYELKLDLQIYESDFNQIEQQVMSPDSELYAFNPDAVVIFFSTKGLLNLYNHTTSEKQNQIAQDRLDLCRNLFYAIRKNTAAKVIFTNYPEYDDGVWGCLANRGQRSFLSQLRRLNTGLTELSAELSDCFIADFCMLQSRFGYDKFFDPSIYVSTEMVLSVDVLPSAAKIVCDILAAAAGMIHKCLILDLDNTVWGGVIGDDGLENIQIGSLGIGKAFSALQYWAKKLKERGVLLAVCSKNDESVAKEPFEKHPDMVLHLDDFAIFTANWEPKADNIRRIQKILNIGFDSMVFVDDNSMERNFVRAELPMVCVPELPEDPADYADYLASLNLFETISFSEADLARTQQYQAEARRVAAQEQFANEDDFLKSMNMEALVSEFNAFNTPRVAQLSQRSNQFNLRTVRYTEADVSARAKDSGYRTFAFSLKDRFGDNGLISVLVLKRTDAETFFIENWLMSCRVLKRGMENFVLNTLVEYAKRQNAKYLLGEYIETPKNHMVSDHYQKLGFVSAGQRLWKLELANYQNKPCFIKRKDQ